MSFDAKTNDKTLDSADFPFVSVIMPIRNEENFIEHSLGAVLRQDYPADRLEVIVMDGMSADRTVEKVLSIANQSNVPVKTIKNTGQTAPFGLNLGINQSTGEIIVRVDGHTIIESDYVKECVAALQSSDAANVGGRMNAFAENIFGQAVALATGSPFGVGNARFHYSQKEEIVDTVYLGAWRREVFETVGLFNEELVRNQDDEFNYRLRAQGGKILLSPKIKSRYYNRSTWRSLWQQYYQYGFWKVRVMQLHPRQMSLRQFVPAIFALSLFVGGVLTLFNNIGIYFLVAVAGVYLLAALIFSVKISIKKGYKFLLLLPICFLTLHLSYGTGFLIGLIYFWKFWFKK